MSFPPPPGSSPQESLLMDPFPSLSSPYCSRIWSRMIALLPVVGMSSKYCARFQLTSIIVVWSVFKRCMSKSSNYGRSLTSRASIHSVIVLNSLLLRRLMGDWGWVSWNTLIKYCKTPVINSSLLTSLLIPPRWDKNFLICCNPDARSSPNSRSAIIWIRLSSRHDIKTATSVSVSLSVSLLLSLNLVRWDNSSRFGYLFPDRFAICQIKDSPRYRRADERYFQVIQTRLYISVKKGVKRNRRSPSCLGTWKVTLRRIKLCSTSLRLSP